MDERSAASHARQRPNVTEIKGIKTRKKDPRRISNLLTRTISLILGFCLFIFFGVISQEKMDQLNLMVENMPHQNDRVWDIHNLSKAQELYVQYDVLFLKYFYFL